MTGKDLLLKALRGEETPRPAWVPYVGCHGGALIGVDATAYLTSADNLVRGLEKACELYRPDGLPVVFDLQLEAEVLGCELQWANEGPPMVVTHPLEGRDDWTVAEIPDLDLNAGRLPLVMEATRRLKKSIGSEVALYGLLCGPFTLALHLLGNDIFLTMFDEEEKIEALTDHCAEIGIQLAEAFLENGCDVIAVVDPMVSQISPEHYEQFVVPASNKLYDAIRAKGGLSCCFVCGDVTRNLEPMCRTTCDSISVDEQIDMRRLRDLALANGKSFGGNLRLTTVLLLGSEDDARLNAIECIDACGSRGFILSPGCDLPYSVKPENVAAAGAMALDSYQRDIARTTAKTSSGDSFDDIVLPDYGSEDGVILDLITLDSETCAPCQYMTDAARRAARTVGGDVQVREHKITTRQGIGMMVKLGVRNLPSICIDGKPSFESIIPEQPRLVKAIEEARSVKAGV